MGHGPAPPGDRCPAARRSSNHDATADVPHLSTEWGVPHLSTEWGAIEWPILIRSFGRASTRGDEA